MAFLVLCVTVLLLGAVKGEDPGLQTGLAPEQKQNYLLQLLTKDARALVELAKHHDDESALQDEAIDSQVSAAEEQDEAKRELGTSRKLMCSKKEDKYSPYFHLCSYCWYWRELPSGYKPRFLNERKCEGNSCLKGYGTCLQQYMNQVVLYNGREVTVRTGSGCKCGIRPDSGKWDLCYG